MIPATPIILPMPFAANGDKNVIATTGEASQPNATWSAGFPAITRLPKQAGGLPPLGLDFNGIFYALSQHIVFLQSGGVYPWQGANAATGFAGLDYLAGARVMGSDGAVYVALKASGPNTPAAGGAGMVGPVDPVSDTTGVWSSLGGALLYNREEIITASGTWEAPVTGWYEVLIIGGGAGGRAYSNTGYCLGGPSGDYVTKLVWFEKGQTVSVTIGAKGLGYAGISTAVSTSWLGGSTTFGEIEATGGARQETVNGQHKFFPRQGAELQTLSGGTYNGVIVAGSGFGGGIATWSGDAAERKSTQSAHWYGGGGAASYTPAQDANAGDGGQGAAIIRCYDPAYAAGPVEAAPAAQTDVAALEAAPMMARMSARRTADTPAQSALVNLYDPETGNGSVWRAEDVPARLAGGMLSEEAWRERCDAKAAEERAAWLVSPDTEAERFEMLRAARDAKLAATDYLMAPDYPLTDEQRAQVAAYRQALRDLPEKEGSPWDGGGDKTPWPVEAGIA